MDAQSPLHRAAQNGVDGAFILKLHLGFGGVYVDVDAVGGDREKEDVGGVVLRRNEALKSFYNGSVQVPIANGTLVDVEVLVAAGFPGMFGAQHKAFRLDNIRFFFDRYQALIGLFA